MILIATAVADGLPDAFKDMLHDWQPPVFIPLGCTAVAAIYLVGFVRLRRSRPELPAWRACSFVCGLLVLWLALGSPLEELADTVLTAHMIEHLLLMAAVPPLLIAGWPTVPLLRGLPRFLRHSVAGPLLRWHPLRRLEDVFLTPVVAWLGMNLTLLLWHIPAAYDYALEHEAVHDFEHVCFLATSLLFWWILLRPWPSRAQQLGWFAPLYLVTADAVNTILSALLAFNGRPVYRYYLQHGSGLGLDPVTDQTTGAAIMWVFGSVAFLLPAMVLLGRLLEGRDPQKQPTSVRAPDPK